MNNAYFHFKDIDSDVDPHNCFVKPLPPLPKLKMDQSTPKKVERRRSTICGNSKISPGIPMRRKSQVMHSSVMAISKDPSKFIDKSEAFVSSTVKDHVKRIGKFSIFVEIKKSQEIVIFLSPPEIKPTQNNGKPNAPFMDKFSLIREFMKTRSLVLEKKVGSSNGMQFSEIMDYFAPFNLFVSQL